MKAFDKWFKKNKPYEVYSCMDMAEKAWRAALEWYQDTMDEIEKRDLPLHGREVIEQELEEK
jgi:hypothetical protein